MHLPNRPLVATLVAIHGYSYTSTQNTVYQTDIALNSAAAGSQTLAGLMASGTPGSFTLL